MRRSRWNVRGAQLALTLLTLSSAVVACGGGGTHSDVPHPANYSTPNDGPALFNPVLVTHSGTPGGRERRPASPPLVGCNYPYCMLQGDTIPLVWTDQAPVPITWSANVASYFTASFNPNPTYSPPHQTTMTLTADRATPVGHYPITASITNADNSTPRVSGSNTIDMVVCDGVTGQCPGPTPTPTPTASPTPSPTPTPTPPPPLAAKSLYTASLVSHPNIPLTDAAPQNLGQLTWHVSGQTSGFKNLQFAATTSGPPHSNALQFDVADDLQPGDYSIHFNVSAASGTSPDTVVVLRVLPPITYGAELNVDGLYEENDQHNIVVSDASQYTTDDGGVVPDFPYAAPATQSLGKTRRPARFDPHFNSFAPPQAVNAELAKADATHTFVCVPYLIESNSAADPTSGTAQGSVRVVSYCRAFPYLVAFFITQEAVNLNRPWQTTTKEFAAGLCNNVGDYRGFAVCESDTFPVVPVLGHAEETRFILHVAYLATQVQKRHAFDGSRYFINKKGVFYPKIPIARDWATQRVWEDGDGFVKFPNGPFRYCPTTNSSKNCHFTDRDALRRNLLKVLPEPPLGFEAHHIHPVEWCGNNSIDNGVFLPQTVADDSLFPDKQHGKFNLWWRTGDFEPDDPRPLCE
jgi:hypothetical protein